MRDIENTRWSILVGAVEIAVLYVPVAFIRVFIDTGFDGWGTVLELVSCILIGFAAFSPKTGWGLLKFLLALPLSWLLLIVFARTGFQVRGVNFWHHNYGWLTAGAYFAQNMTLMFMLSRVCAAAVIGIILSFLYKEIKRPLHPVFVIKHYICPIFCVAVCMAVMSLYSVFPTLYQISRSNLGG